MKRGDLIRLIPELEDDFPFKPMWDEPPTFLTSYTQNHIGRFRYTDVGILLESKIVEEHKNLSRCWIRILSPLGTVGWLRGKDLERVNENG